jgi:hypothetical protein
MTTFVTPYSFVIGTKIKSSEVNANFAYIRNFFNTPSIDNTNLSASAGILPTQIDLTQTFSTIRVTALKPAGATAGGSAYGDGTDLKFTGAGTSGQALISAGASAPAFGTVGIAGGGTGLTTVPTNGKLLIGNGTNYTLATLASAGGTITITNGAGSINLEVAASTTVSYVKITMTQGQIQGMFAENGGAGHQLVANPGAGKAVIFHKIVLRIADGGFGGGGLVGIGYGSGVTAATCTISAANSFIAGGGAGNGNMVIFNGYDSASPFYGSDLTFFQNKAIYIGNATGAFTGGSGGCTIEVWYSVVG